MFESDEAIQANLKDAAVREWVAWCPFTTREVCRDRDGLVNRNEAGIWRLRNLAVSIVLVFWKMIRRIGLGPTELMADEIYDLDNCQSSRSFHFPT